MAAATQPLRARRRLGRLERSALSGVLVREVINYSSYWRSVTFSSTVEPTIYLLAFGFGFGSLVSKVGRLRLRRVRRHRHGRHRGAVLVGVRRDVRRRSSSTSSSTPTTRSSPPRSTPRSSSPARRCGSRSARRVYGCTPLLVAMVFGLDPSWGMLLVPPIASSPASAGRSGGCADLRADEVDRQLLLRDQHGDHADVPRRGHVLPDQRPAAVGADRRLVQPALPLRRAGAPRRVRLRGLGRPRAPRHPVRLRHC